MRIKPILAVVAVTAAIAFISIPKNKPATALCSVQAVGATLDKSTVYKTTLTQKKLSETEEYLIGVVAAEIPADYNIEALKAQAIAARTYAIRALENDSTLAYSSIGQAYISKEEMKKRWGNSFSHYYGKIKKAVKETEGIICLYNNEPILAAFCASSGGKTEESENVWTRDLPYLTTVDSPWDINSNSQSLTFTEKEITNLLGGIPEIQSRTEAGYVKSLTAGKKTYKGTEVRELLGLKSANFTVSHSKGNIIISTVGYGHGVGMSQIGAGAMAKEGSTCEEILTHYYSGISLGKIK